MSYIQMERSILFNLPYWKDLPVRHNLDVMHVVKNVGDHLFVHLMVHLADEALACGPVRFRWMYPFERLMKTYKGYVKNMAHPKGCIAEHYVIEESILYCMEYMPDGDRGSHKRTHQRFLDDDGECDEEPLDKGRNVFLTNTQHQQVRRWVLDSYRGIAEWHMKYKTYLSTTTPKGPKKNADGIY
ncbi:hypothetical protein AAC387_Pa12g0973 [Persea americana]